MGNSSRKGGGGAPISKCTQMVSSDTSSMQYAEEAGKVGLRNLGNTCFMNAGLQCLSHIQPLVDYFLTGRFEEEVPPADGVLGTDVAQGKRRGDLARAFQELQRSLWTSKKGVYNPKELRAKLAVVAPHLFEDGEQQDVQEFLAFCLDGLHEDLNRVSVKPPHGGEEREKEDDRLRATHGDEFAAALAWMRHLEREKSFLVDLLQGQQRSSLVCSVCGNTSSRFEPFLYLSVPVTRSMATVTDAVRSYVTEELLSGDDQWFCDKCKAKVDATKKIEIWKLPPVLVLHLKRFEFCARTMRFEKTENRLSMKLSQLDLSDLCSSPQRDGATYDVVCVANHAGAFGSGHYTASCRVDGTWHKFDDSRVTQLDGRNVVTRESYVIFLVRRPPEDTPSGSAGTSQLKRKSGGSKEGSGKGAASSASNPRILLRRQTPLSPEKWPHDVVDARKVLEALGISKTTIVEPHVPSGSASSLLAAATADTTQQAPGNRNLDGPDTMAEFALPDSAQSVPPDMKRQRTLNDFFSIRGPPIK